MAANVARVPLNSRHNSLLGLPHSKPNAGGIKRPRSPDLCNEGAFNATLATKRIRSQSLASGTANTGLAVRDERRERRHEKLLKEEEFKEKYTKAFPKFNFYFDGDDSNNHVSRKSLQAKVIYLKGHIADFFDKGVSHLITNKDPSSLQSTHTIDKENVLHESHESATKSPAKRPRLTSISSKHAGKDPLSNALLWGIKIWSYEKLESVLTRCLSSSQSKPLMPKQQTVNDLGRLLHTEKIKGSAEADPASRRYGFSYFSRGSCFLLVEDARMEMAPPYIHEYMLPKNRKDADAKKPWPALYCHPQSRGPFIPFDDKERRRWEKAQAALKKEEVERREAEEKKAQMDLVKRRAAMIPSSTRNGGDLRRTVSMNNLQKQQDIDLDVDADESACASGFLASGQSAYVAASGNSVHITSTTGTTSTAGYSFGHELPQSLRTHLSREIVTSRKPLVICRQGEDRKNEAPEVMGPPSIIPEKRASTLRRSASTNSMRLPKRDESTKPGYCESCRQRFDDFKFHIASRKHVKFARDDANFSHLDFVLARVKRRTLTEVKEQEALQHAHDRSEYSFDL